MNIYWLVNDSLDWPHRTVLDSYGHFPEHLLALKNQKLPIIKRLRINSESFNLVQKMPSKIIKKLNSIAGPAGGNQGAGVEPTPS